MQVLGGEVLGQPVELRGIEEGLRGKKKCDNFIIRCGKLLGFFFFFFLRVDFPELNWTSFV